MATDGPISPSAKEPNVEPDFVFIVTYACPRCHAALETRSSGPPSWLRCPSCGRASLPPEHNRNVAFRPEVNDEEPAIFIGASDAISAAPPSGPRPMAARPSATPSRAQSTRLMLGSGFFVAMFLTLFSLLDANPALASLFGVASAVFLFLLTRPIAPNIRG